MGTIINKIDISGQEPEDILKAAGEEDLFEKAKHNVGDIHPNGKWIWTEYAPGKFDWKSKNGKHHKGKTSADDVVTQSQTNVQPQTSKSPTSADKTTSKPKETDKTDTNGHGKIEKNPDGGFDLSLDFGDGIQKFNIGSKKKAEEIRTAIDNAKSLDDIDQAIYDMCIEGVGNPVSYYASGVFSASDKTSLTSIHSANGLWKRNKPSNLRERNLRKLDNSGLFALAEKKLKMLEDGHQESYQHIPYIILRDIPHKYWHMTKSQLQGEKDYYVRKINNATLMQSEKQTSLERRNMLDKLLSAKSQAEKESNEIIVKSKIKNTPAKSVKLKVENFWMDNLLNAKVLITSPTGKTIIINKHKLTFNNQEERKVLRKFTEWNKDTAWKKYDVSATTDDMKILLDLAKRNK